MVNLTQSIIRFKMNNQQTESLQKDISYCIDILGLNDNQIGTYLRYCEDLNLTSCEYLHEELSLIHI